MPQLSLWIFVLCCSPYQAPSCLEKALATGICNEMSRQDGRITSQSWVRENYSISTEILLFCCKLDLWEHTIKRGEKRGVPVWHILPQPISSHLAVLPPPASIYGMNNEVKFLKLPVSSFSRSGRRNLFSSGMIIWPLPVFPPLA